MHNVLVSVHMCVFVQAFIKILKVKDYWGPEGEFKGTKQMKNYVYPI